MSFVSYAQNFEDVLLHRVFGGQETGFYVDVGAYHPVEGSVTKAFYDRGWSGINIEPGSIFSELVKDRPRDINLQMAVLDHRGEVQFVDDKADPGMSHVIMGEADCTGRRMVPCDTLEAIVQAHSRGRPVDFVKLDAEGAETAIISSTNWRCLRPRVLVVEATLPWSTSLANQDWEPTLLEQGYVRAYFDGINCFYIPESERHALSRHFQAPVNVLDRAEHYSFAALRIQWDNQQNYAERLEADMARLEADAARLATERHQLRVELDDARKDITRLSALADSLRTELNEQQERITQLTAERDALATNVKDENEEGTNMAPSGDSKPSRVRAVGRRAALVAYKVVRPVVRPVAWRFRSFLIEGLSEQLQHGGAVRVSPQPETHTGCEPQRETRTECEPQPEALTVHQMNELATEMERALLTLALERRPELVVEPRSP